MNPTDTPQPSLATFSFELLQHLIKKAGSASIQMVTLPGKATIIAGKHRFTASTKEEVLDTFLRWAMNASFEHQDPDVLARAAAEKEALEKKEFESQLEELTKDGMTDFGKAAERAKQELRTRTLILLDEIDGNLQVGDVVNANYYLTKAHNMGYEEVSLADIYEAMKTRATALAVEQSRQG